MKHFLLISILVVITIFIIINGCTNYNYTHEGNQLKNITAEEFMEMRQTKGYDKYQIIDVRTKSEYDSGHIKDAILKPVQETNTVEDISEFDKSRPVIIYCRSGNRSFTASKVFVKAGYNTTNLLGGIVDLEKAGYNLITR